MSNQLITINGKYYRELLTVRVPTNDPSPIGFHTDIVQSGSLDYAPNFGFDVFDTTKNFQHRPQHLYILSHDEIKENDWVYRSDVNVIFQMHVHGLPVVNSLFKKIIASTDPKLSIPFENSISIIQLPHLSPEFLKLYCEKDGPDHVFVEYDRTECEELCGGFCLNQCPHGITHAHLLVDVNNTVNVIISNDKNPHGLELGKDYWFKYVHCESKWEKAKITRFTDAGFPWADYYTKLGNGIISPNCYEISETEPISIKTCWTADEVVDFAANMIAQYKFGNTNIESKSLLKESLLSK